MHWRIAHPVVIGAAACCILKKFQCMIRQITEYIRYADVLDCYAVSSSASLGENENPNFHFTPR